MRFLVALFLITAAACGPLPPPEPPPTPDPIDPPAQADCRGVCGRATDLGCDWAGPTPRGATCEEWCQDNQDNGIVKWDLACRAGAGSCAAMDACERR